MGYLAEASRLAKKSEALYNMLAEGKKVTTANDERRIKYKEDWNDPSDTRWASDKTQMTDVVWFRANPQMNRIIATLADGREKDIEIGLFDIRSFTFVEYITDPKPDGWRDVFDAKRVFPMNWANARSKAKELNYPYICWGGRIYATRDSYQSFPICTEEEV